MALLLRIPIKYQSKFNFERTNLKNLQKSRINKKYLVYTAKKQKIPRLIPLEGNKDIINAINYSLQSMNRTGNRINRYIQIYKAYESLTSKNNRNIIFSSIRHSLSHSDKELTSPKVRQILNKMFNSIEINLDDSKNERIFFENYCKLLIKVDKLINDRILNIPFTKKKIGLNYYLVSKSKTILFDKQLKLDKF